MIKKYLFLFSMLSMVIITNSSIRTLQYHIHQSRNPSEIFKMRHKIHQIIHTLSSSANTRTVIDHINQLMYLEKDISFDAVKNMIPHDTLSIQQWRSRQLHDQFLQKCFDTYMSALNFTNIYHKLAQVFLLHLSDAFIYRRIVLLKVCDRQIIAYTDHQTFYNIEYIIYIVLRSIHTELDDE